MKWGKGSLGDGEKGEGEGVVVLCGLLVLAFIWYYAIV